MLEDTSILVYFSACPKVGEVPLERIFPPFQKLQSPFGPFLFRDPILLRNFLEWIPVRLQPWFWERANLAGLVFCLFICGFGKRKAVVGPQLMSGLTFSPPRLTCFFSQSVSDLHSIPPCPLLSWLFPSCRSPSYRLVLFPSPSALAWLARLGPESNFGSSKSSWEAMGNVGIF